MNSRSCTKCGIEKSLDDFAPHPRGKFGRQPSCHACNAARMRAANANASPEQRARRSLVTRLSYERNRSRANARSRAWYAANKDRAVASMLAWNASNVDMLRAIRHNARARRSEAAGTLTRRDVAELREMSGGRCAYCLASDRKLSVDHVTALAAGGTNDPDNLVMACKPCNSRKGPRGILTMVRPMQEAA